MVNEYSIDNSDTGCSLDEQAKQTLEKMGPVDIVIGIPSHRNGRTIGEVLRAISRGISEHYLGRRILLLNADGGSSDNTTHLVMEAAMPANVSKLVTPYIGPMGRGTAVKAIYEACEITKAQACLVLDARIPGIQPDWISGLVQPVLDGNDVAIGAYDSSAYAAAFTDNVVYPFIRAFLSVDIRNPLPAEMCLSGEYVANLLAQDVWETDVSKFGVNMWIAMEALIAKRRLVQVQLGYRGDPSGDPGSLADPRLLHVLSTLFRFLTTYHRLWFTSLPVQHIPVISTNTPQAALVCPDCIPQLITALGEGAQVYRREWSQILSAKDIDTIRALADTQPEDFDFTLELWTRVLLRFAFVYNCGEGDPDKVAEAFLPLFYGRAAAYIKRTSNMTLEEREEEVARVVRALLDAKPAFAALWQERPFWLDPAWF